MLRTLVPRIARAQARCVVSHSLAGLRDRECSRYSVSYSSAFFGVSQIAENSVALENKSPVRDMSTSNSMTSRGNTIDLVSTRTFVTSTSARIFETQTNDCDVAIRAGGGAKPTTLPDAKATSRIVLPDANAEALSKSAGVTRSDLLAATAPFENVFTPVRLNCAADRCVRAGVRRVLPR